MSEINLGSVLLSTPDKREIRSSRIYTKWKVESINIGDNIYIVKETAIDDYTRILMWIDIYSHIFPEEIVEDAKRIAYDFKEDGFLKRTQQQFHALICLNIACMFHNFDFMSKKDEIIRAKGEGRRVFGVKIRKYSSVNQQFANLNKYTDMAIQTLPDDKFEILSKMHKKIGDMNGREMGSLCGNQQA